MTVDEVIVEFLKRIPFEYPTHMLCGFSREGAAGRVLPFLRSLVGVLARIDTVSPGYAVAILDRVAGITGTGEDQYEAILQVLAEVYVTGGVLESADVEDERPCFAHEPGAATGKNPECEVRIGGQWCAIEVKIAYSGRVDHRFRTKPIRDSGMSITSERSDAGYGLLG